MHLNDVISESGSEEWEHNVGRVFFWYQVGDNCI